MMLARDGAQRFRAAFSPSQAKALENRLSMQLQHVPGVRLLPAAGFAELISPADELAASIIDPEARPIRAVLFDKTRERNWALGWHQDRTIAVQSRVEVTGFKNWTFKAGIHHVVPPFEFLERMLTVRIHLDPIDSINAPLLVSPGSHRIGIVPERDINPAVARFGSKACLADRGDIWVYSTPILHASEGTSSPARRRVLQILYSADELPGGLQWLGV